MALGIKLSKTAIFRIIYHFWDPESGDVETNYPDYDEYYIMGVGTDNLAKATHDYYIHDELALTFKVYLEQFGSDLDSTYNRVWENGTFSNPVDKITPADYGDIHLYAKWITGYYAFKFKYTPHNVNDPNPPDSNYLLPDNALVFSWSAA